MKHIGGKRLILFIITSCILQGFFSLCFLGSKKAETAKADLPSEPIYLMAASRASLNGWDTTGPHTEETDGKYGIYFLESNLDGTDSVPGTQFNYVSPNRMLSQFGPGNAETRDAAILWYHNKFWVMWPHSPTNNKDGLHGHFDLYSSTDLVNWVPWGEDSEGNPLTPFTLSGAVATGGGDWYVDENGFVHALLPFNPAGEDDVDQAYIYESRPLNRVDSNDPTSDWDLSGDWTATPQQLLTTGGAPIGHYDPTIIHCGEYHYLIVAPGAWYKSTGSIINGWESYTPEDNNTAGVNGLPEGYSATPILFDSEGKPATWRVYADDKAGGAYTKTGYADLSVSGNTFTSLGSKVLTQITVNPFGPNVIRLDPSKPSDLPAIQAVQNLKAQYPGIQYSGAPERDLRYPRNSTDSTDSWASAVGGNDYPLNPDYNYPNRFYNLNDPGTDADWYLDFQLPSSVAGSTYSAVPATVNATLTDERTDYGACVRRYRIYPYKK
jgi:hypothetical protein